jgi:hypothetical protein
MLTFSLHGAENDGAFQLIWRGRNVEVLAYTGAEVPLALGQIGTRGAALQVSLDVQTLFDF